MRIVFAEGGDSFSWNVVGALPFPRRDVEIVPAPSLVADPPRLDGADALVVGPGPTDPERAGLVMLVREAARRRLPTLGICLGHQAIGAAFGAKVRRVPPVHGRTAVVRFVPSRLFPGFEGDLRAMRYHSLALDGVGAPLRTVASCEGLPMAIEHETLPIAGLQFHPDSYATERGPELVAAFFAAVGLPGRVAPRRRSSSPSPPQSGWGFGGEAPDSIGLQPPAARASERRAEGAAGGAPSHAPPIALSELDALPSFALLGPGFTGRQGPGDWRLLSELEPAPGALDLVLADFEDRAPSTFRASASRDGPLAADVAPAPLAPALDARGHADGVQAIRALIAAGDVYQVNLTLRARLAPVPGGALLATALARGAPPFAAWIRLPGGREIVSASPELLLEVAGRRVRSEPMKGTAAAGEELRLAASAKDAAELAMITDLVRNDLAPVCVPGSVTVAAERRLVSLPYAVQAVADVEGELAPGAGPLEVLAALHPGGSVTGAPKPAALAAIAALERTPRGAYCGALGHGAGARFVASLLIRTAERARGGEAWTCGVGGGIVIDSDPVAELAEATLKLEALCGTRHSA